MGTNTLLGKAGKAPWTLDAKSLGCHPVHLHLSQVFATQSKRILTLWTRRAILYQPVGTADDDTDIKHGNEDAGWPFHA